MCWRGKQSEILKMKKLKTLINHIRYTYWQCFKYIINHKINVGIECWKHGLYLHAFTHDLSKLLPSEFFGHAWRFHKNQNTPPVNWNIKILFRFARHRHYHRNKHHWNYWVLGKKTIPMPEKYVMQMIMDWRGMARNFGGSARIFCNSKRGKRSMRLHPDTVMLIEKCLDRYGD